MPDTFNYMSPLVPTTINGQSDPTSQRLHVSFAIPSVNVINLVRIWLTSPLVNDQDICTPYSVPIPEDPPFDLA